MKKVIVWMTAVMMSSAVCMAQMSIEDRVAAELEVYKAELSLTDEQAVALSDALTDKISVGKEAYLLKKDGDAEAAKEMNKAAGKEFYQAMKSIFTKEQMAIWQENKEAIKEKLQAARE